MSTPTPDLTRQSLPVDAEAIRDRITHSFQLLGIKSLVQAVTFATNRAIAVSPLDVSDAAKLADALDSLPELGRKPLMGTCVHIGVRAGQTCPHCQQPVPQPAPQR